MVRQQPASIVALLIRKPAQRRRYLSKQFDQPLNVLTNSAAVAGGAAIATPFKALLACCGFLRAFPIESRQVGPTSAS
jgi:hypothetical protein